MFELVSISAESLNGMNSLVVPFNSNIYIRKFFLYRPIKFSWTIDFIYYILRDNRDGRILFNFLFFVRVFLTKLK